MIRDNITSHDRDTSTCPTISSRNITHLSYGLASKENLDSMIHTTRPQRNSCAGTSNHLGNSMPEP